MIKRVTTPKNNNNKNKNAQTDLFFFFMIKAAGRRSLIRNRKLEASNTGGLSNAPRLSHAPRSQRRAFSPQFEHAGPLPAHTAAGRNPSHGAGFADTSSSVAVSSLSDLDFVQAGCCGVTTVTDQTICLQERTDRPSHCRAAVAALSIHVRIGTGRARGFQSIKREGSSCPFVR